MSTLPACCSSGGAVSSQTRGAGPDGEFGGDSSRAPLRVRASITWSAVRTTSNQNTQVTTVASRYRVASRSSRPRGLRGLRVGADIGGLAYRLSLLSMIVNNDNRYVKSAAAPCHALRLRHGRVARSHLHHPARGEAA